MCQNVATRLESTLHIFTENIAHKVYFFGFQSFIFQLQWYLSFLLSNFALAAKVTWCDDYWGSVWPDKEPGCLSRQTKASAQSLKFKCPPEGGRDERLLVPSSFQWGHSFSDASACRVLIHLQAHLNYCLSYASFLDLQWLLGHSTTFQ